MCVVPPCSCSLFCRCSLLRVSYHLWNAHHKLLICVCMYIQNSGVERCLAVGGLRNGEGAHGLNDLLFFRLFVLKEVLCYMLRTLATALLDWYCSMNKLGRSGGMLPHKNF